MREEMETRESIPCLNLEGVASDGRENGAEKHESNRSGDEVEARTCGAAAGGGDGRGGERKSEIENSKSSSDLLPKDVCSLSSSSSSLCPAFRNGEQDRRLKRHRPDRAGNTGSNALETNESSFVLDSMRSSTEVIPAPGADDHLQISEHRSRRQKLGRDREAEESVASENKRLREALLRERRHHMKEKNRIRQVLIAIDEALSTLPTRLGKIRIQNQKNLMKMNALPVEFHDRGDSEMIVGSSARYLDGIRLSDDVYSYASDPSVFEKIESLNDLIEGMKRGRAAPIEAVLDGELCAISLLKNEIKYTKRKIDQKSNADSESAIVPSRRPENGQISYPKNRNLERGVDAEEIEKLEKYIWLQKKAISVLSLQVEKTRELYVKEMKEKERAQCEKKSLMSEVVRLKNMEESQRLRTNDATPMPRPFRLIKDLKCQLQEKDKILSNFKAKISRLEAVTANKGTLLENEKKKTEELEGRLKILASENKSFSLQINSLQLINKELKDQMEVLKTQVEILIEKNAEFCSNSPFDLQKNLTELMEMLKKDGARARTIQEEAEKLKEQRSQNLEELDELRASFEKCEKMNTEYLRTLKGVILYLHNYQTDGNLRRRSRKSYVKAKEILGITEQELENLFGGSLKNTSEKELQDLYDQCYSLVNDCDDHEFSFKLSAWLFDLIKQKTMHQNLNESLSD